MTDCSTFARDNKEIGAGQRGDGTLGFFGRAVARAGGRLVRGAETVFFLTRLGNQGDVSLAGGLLHRLPELIEAHW